MNIHGTGLVIDGIGILLRGPSGAGKSLLTLELLNDCALRGQQGFLIADDRIDLTVEDKKLVMTAPDAIAGLIELRGRGIVKRAFVESASLNLVIDIVDDLVRMIEEEDMVTKLLGVKVMRAPIPNRQSVDISHQRLLALEAIASAKQAGMQD